jgi:DNA-directed RNA polymerase
MSAVITNESSMKSKGEDKVWNSIKKNDGKYKEVSSTQIGQQILLDEAIRIQDQFKTWVSKASKVDRKVLKQLFCDDDIILEKLTQTLLLLSGVISGSLEAKNTTSKKKKTRHKGISNIQKKIFEELSFEQTWRVVEVIVDYSEYFEIEKVAMVKGDSFNWSLGYVCTLSEVILNKLSIEAARAFYPMPIFEKPKDWKYENEQITGGYHEYQYEMIRIKKKYLKYNKYSSEIFDTLNYIQSTPWKVNNDLLHAVEKDLAIPKKEDFVKSLYPDPIKCRFDVRIKDNDDHGLSDLEVILVKSERKLFQQAVSLYQAEVKDFESAMGKYRAVKMSVEIAKEYTNKIVYFPHSYDSRGRVYPLPVGLSPQGSDAVKALLEYSEGETLNRRGVQWAFAYLASLYGDDKLHFEARYQRGLQLIDADYKEADEPYQFLAHQIECKKVIEDNSYKFKGRIHLDACNSGSQFTSALTGDLEGCLATNVIPTINKDGLCDRQDAYLLVSDRAKDLDKEVLKDSNLTKEDRKVYEMILQLLEDNGRKICKRPVMVSNYGGTAGGRADMLFDMFRELNVPREQITMQNAIKMAKIIGDSITGVLNGGKAFEKYVQQMNNMIAKKNVPVTWTTSDGFFVVHVKNKELKPKQVTLMLPNARRRTTIIKKIYAPDVSPMKMRSAISPNYIHSLDAELLRRVALQMFKEGIVFSDWIHDSFGCHPNYVDEMLDITKQVFLNMMLEKPLDALDKELRQQALNNGVTEKMVNKIVKPDLEGINYEGGDLDALLKSEWFFS